MKWISHRGESYDAPENTIASYKLAMERDTDGMECDLHLTADNVIVCSHDWHTERMGSVRKVIAESTYDELQTVDVGQKKSPSFAGTRIPKWSEAAPLISQGRVFFVELKSDVRGLLPGLKEQFEKQPQNCGEIAFISFNQENIRIIRKEYPNMRGALLLCCQADENGKPKPSADEVIALLSEIKATGVDISACRAIDKEYVRKVRDAGFEFHVWTIDDEDTARYFMDLGVDSITSNRAAYLKHLLDK